MDDYRWTQSSRRHRVGRARARQVLADPVAIVMTTTPDGQQMLLHLGDDHEGRALEVGVLPRGDEQLVIHVMDLRSKHRREYEAGKEDRA